MPKSSNKRKKQKMRKSKDRTPTPSLSWWKRLISRTNSTILWLAATGILAGVFQFSFKYFTGEVEARYLAAAGRGYEFQLTNKSSTAQIIKSFRIVPDFEQELVLKITDNVYGELSQNGISIPGGSTTYMPAYEFRELDGYVIPANSSTEFRIPPLVARDYMRPESVIVSIEYQTRSANGVIRWLENLMKKVEIFESKRRIRFLVAENYWTPIGNEASVDAIRAACRENDVFGNSSICGQRMP